MQPVEGCDVAPFHVAATAAGYSGVAGLLAGFAFTAILMPLTLRREATASLGPALMNFTAAFFGLLLSAVQYAVLAGDPARGRAVHLELIIGLVFGVGVLVLLYGVSQLIDANRHDRQELQAASRLLRAVSLGAMPLLVTGLLLGGVSDQVVSRELSAGRCPTSTSGNQEWDLAVLIITWALIIVLNVKGPRSSGRRGGSGGRERHGHLVPGLALTVSLVGAFYVAMASSLLTTSFETPEWAQHVLFAGGCAAVLLVTAGAFRSGPTDAEGDGVSEKWPPRDPGAPSSPASTTPSR